MQSIQNARDFILTHFSAIVLSLGLILVFSSTVEINNNRNPKNTNDKLNTYYGLNVSGIVFLSLFVGNEYIFPHLVKNTAHI